MIKQVEGIIIKESSYKESSKLLTILTKDGTLSLLAKGAKNLKSPLRVSSTKLTHANFTIYYKENGLSTVTSIDTITSFKNIKKDMEKVSYASFLLDLAYQVGKENQKEEIYTLLLDSLNKIEEGFDPLVISNILELKYLDYLGVSLTLDACASCGAKENIVTISLEKGGLLCKNCKKDEITYSDTTLKLLRMYYYVDIKKISKLDISASSKTEVNDFLDAYYDKYTGLYLKTKSFLKNLEKLYKTRS